MNDVKPLTVNPAACGVAAGTLAPVERLPFTIRVVQTRQELQKAILIRHAAYGRHLPEFAASLRSPEAS